MSRRWVLVGLALVALSCGDRDIFLEIHTPARCCGSVRPGCVEDPCPLVGLVSVRMRIERADGSLAFEKCSSTPRGVCTYADLMGLTLIDDIPPSDGVELLVDGFSSEGCVGEIYFACESLGDHQVDLRRRGQAVPVWCDCAPLDR